MHRDPRGAELEDVVPPLDERLPPKPENARAQARCYVGTRFVAKGSQLAASYVDLVGQREADRLIRKGGRRRYRVEGLNGLDAAVFSRRVEDDLGPDADRSRFDRPGDN